MEQLQMFDGLKKYQKQLQLKQIAMNENLQKSVIDIVKSENNDCVNDINKLFDTQRLLYDKMHENIIIKSENNINDGYIDNDEETDKIDLFTFISEQTTYDFPKQIKSFDENSTPPHINRIYSKKPNNNNNNSTTNMSDNISLESDNINSNTNTKSRTNNKQIHACAQHGGKTVSYIGMALDAIVHTKHGAKGVSRFKITRYIERNYQVLLGSYFNATLRKALFDGIRRGVLIYGHTKERYKITKLGKKENNEKDKTKKYYANNCIQQKHAKKAKRAEKHAQRIAKQKKNAVANKKKKAAKKKKKAANKKKKGTNKKKRSGRRRHDTNKFISI
eukprot:227996_1